MFFPYGVEYRLVSSAVWAMLTGDWMAQLPLAAAMLPKKKTSRVPDLKEPASRLRAKSMREGS